jgi:hypothetical protein
MPYERIEPYAKALLASIKDVLGNVDWFTREDLLHLETFDQISTISRYGYVCASVRWLTREGLLVELSRTELALPAKAKLYSRSVPLHHTYLNTVERVVRGFGQLQLFSVMDVVNRWKNDPHLTENAKRVVVRRALTVLVSEEKVKVQDFHTFYLEHYE